LLQIDDLPSGTPVAFESALGWSWLVQLLEHYGSSCTWCTRYGARRSPRPG
jgi:hypothetical protein